MTNFERTKNWLIACGKEPSAENLSVQVGCHLEEFMEFMDTLGIASNQEGQVYPTPTQLQAALETMNLLATSLKDGVLRVEVMEEFREECLDALCDLEVTGTGVAYLAGFAKDSADLEVLAANERKLVDGKPVLKPNGKIGKPEGWVAPDLKPFV
jgi:predicted HAD superfamily Cof-like phosphohydrolase